jgi:uncharacterized membrane protein YcaP (DUF421 family)
MFLLWVALHTIVIYAFLVLALSRIARSEMAGLTPTGYMVIALLGSSVETGLYRASGSLAAGLVSAATILAANYVTSLAMTKWPRLGRPLLGTPLVLVDDGKLISSHLQRARLSEEDLKAAIRKRGYDKLEDIRFAVLEIDGSVSAIPMKPAGKQ